MVKQNGLAGSLQSELEVQPEQQLLESQCPAQSASTEHEQKTQGVRLGVADAEGVEDGDGTTHVPDPSHIPILHGVPNG